MLCPKVTHCGLVCASLTTGTVAAHKRGSATTGPREQVWAGQWQKSPEGFQARVQGRGKAVALPSEGPRFDQGLWHLPQGARMGTPDSLVPRKPQAPGGGYEQPSSRGEGDALVTNGLGGRT